MYKVVCLNIQLVIIKRFKKNENFLDLTITKLQHIQIQDIQQNPLWLTHWYITSLITPVQHKLSPTQLHRLNRILLEQRDYNIEDEVNTTKHLAETNGYDRTIINKLVRKPKTNNSWKTENNKFMCSLSVEMIIIVLPWFGFRWCCVCVFLLLVWWLCVSFCLMSYVFLLHCLCCALVCLDV